ncbi:MAG: hypothetical protein ABI612_06105 [Betaproteobacteria bacterium]
MPMKELAASRFDVIALSLPRGLGFGDNPPVGAWLSNDDATCAVLTQNSNSGAYGVLIMRRRIDDVWCVVHREDDSFAKDDAEALIGDELEKQSPPVPIPPGVRRRASLGDIRNVEPSAIFKALASPQRRLGAWMLNQLYLALPNPDENWASDCQTGNFHTRLWEAHLLGSFREQGLLVTQDYRSPDFHVSNRRGGEAWIEAVTANPNEKYDHYATPRVDAPQERRELSLGPAAVRFAKSIRSKRDRKYDELPHVVGKPFALALADFHAPGSMLWSRVALMSYLYGFFVREIERDGIQVAAGEKVTTLRGHENIPCGLFRFEENANLSALIFSNACSIAKLSRVALSAGAVLEDYRYVRIGEFFDRTRGALRGIPFSMDVSSAEYRALWPPYMYEPWSAEMEIFHNPMANHPIPDEMFPEITHWREVNGEIVCRSFFEASVLKSHTLILKASDPIPNVAEVVKNFRYTYEGFGDD